MRRPAAVVLGGLLVSVLVLATGGAAQAQSTQPALPVTGRAIPILAAGIAIGVALLLRAGRSRLDDSDDDEN